MTHPPAPVQSVEEIARGLTKAQREQVSLMGEFRWETIDWNASTTRALERRGLIVHLTPPYYLRLTDLGRAVAAALRGGSE